MREVITDGSICLDDEYGFTYHVADIRYIEREDESYCYEFRPDYSVIELLNVKIYQGIPGLDLSLKKEVYVRENMVPVFISERTPGENREDLWELLKACHMEYLNRLELLIRTDTRYSGDGFYVCRAKKRGIVRISSIAELGNRSSVISRKVLEVICAGGEIHTDAFTISDSNRRSYYELFLALYTCEKKYMDDRRRDGIGKSVKQGKYTGRSRIKIDPLEMQEIFEAYEAGALTGKGAAERLGVSASTFYRRYKEYHK